MNRLFILVTSTLSFAMFGCQELPEYQEGEASGLASVELQGGPDEDKEFPDFPLHYSGNGVFFDTSDPRNTLVASYIFDMELGVNREPVHYIDREIIAMHFFDLDPSDGTDPDREYLIDIDERGRPTNCALSPFPLPNVFSRDWWLHNNMVFEGQETINGFLADCWQGTVPEFGVVARFCNRADVYPDFAPLLKKVHTFEFFDYFGRALSRRDRPPPSFFRLPRICRDL